MARRSVKRFGNANEIREEAFAETILSIPAGKAASYGQVAAAASYHRAVAHFLKTAIQGELPWQRMLGARGQIKLGRLAAAEQRPRLKMEGVPGRRTVVRSLADLTERFR